MERPIPYRGEEGYIFISYAHRDSGQVWPIIQRMQKDGFRVWYDDGIDPGTEWDENIAAHVAGCGYFVAFLSENYLASNNCKDELNFSRDQEKPQLLIYLEDVHLPHGMAMRLGRNQAIFHNRYKDKEEFFDKLYDAQDISFFNGSNKAPELKTAAELTSQTFQTAKEKKTALWPIVVSVLLIVAAATAAFFLWPKEEPKKQPEASAQETVEADNEMKQAINVLLSENDQMKVTALDTALDSRYFTLTLAVENKGQADLYLTTDNFYLNGVACEMDWRGNLTAGEVNMVELSWDRSVMETHGIDPEAVTVIEGELGGWYLDDSGEIDACPIAYYPYGEENAVFVAYTPAEADVVLLDTEDFFVAAREDRYDETTGQWCLELVCINRTEENLIFNTEDTCLNNYRLTGGMNEWVYAGRMAYCEAVYSEMQWRTTDYEKVLSYSGKLYIYNWDSFADGEDQGYPFVYYPEGEEAARQIAPRQVAEEDILLENDYVRVAYLGSREYGNSKADLIYFYNLTDEFQEVDYSLDYQNEENRVGTVCYLEAGQESIYLSYRRTTAVNDEQALLNVNVCDLEFGSFHTYDEVTFTIRDPEDS